MKKPFKLFSKKYFIVFLSVILALGIIGASAAIILSNSDEVVKNFQGQKLALELCFAGLYEEDIAKVAESTYPKDSPEYYNYIEQNRDTLFVENMPLCTITEFAVYSGADHKHTEAEVSFTVRHTFGNEGEQYLEVCFVKHNGKWYLTPEVLPSIIGAVNPISQGGVANHAPNTTPLVLTSAEKLAYSTGGGYKTHTVGQDHYVNNQTFEGCTNLHEIILPSNTQEIRSEFFADCSSLVAVSFDDESDLFTSIDGVLYNKDVTKLIYFPRGKGVVNTIPQDEFHIPNTVIAIEGWAFFNYNGQLKKIVFPASIKTVPQGAFYGAFSTSSTQVLLNEGLKKIDTFAFAYSFIQSINIPKSVIEINVEAFVGASTLHNVIIPEDSALQTIGSAAFNGANNLYSIYIPQGVTKIENWAFDGCHNLSEITLPENIESIGMFAFRDCYNLIELTLPSSIKYIGKGAFCGNNILTLHINFSSQPPSWHKNWDYGLRIPAVWDTITPSS